MFFLKQQQFPVAPVNIQPVYSLCEEFPAVGKQRDTGLVENDGNSNTVDSSGDLAQL